MFWFIVIVIVAGTAAALAIAIRQQRKCSRRQFRLEIANRGNVRSRYQVRAEDSDGTFRFRFVLGGDNLPERVYSEPEEETVAEPTPAGPLPAQAEPPPVPPAERAGGLGAKAEAAEQKVNQAMGGGNAVADLLLAIGGLLPSSMAAPFLQKAGQIQRGQMRVREVQRAPRRVMRLKEAVPRPRRSPKRSAGQESASHVSSHAPSRVSSHASSHASSHVPATGQVWVETPAVRPGETLALDLFLRATVSGRKRNCAFQIVSRSLDQENAPLVVQDGGTQLGGGFWSRPYLPYGVILATAAGLLLVVSWLTATGALAW